MNYDILVNGQNLHSFGDLESFESAIPEIETLEIEGLDVVVFSDEHYFIYEFFKSWNTYHSNEQKIIAYYAEARGYDLIDDIDTIKEEAIDNFLGVYEDEREAVKELFKLSLSNSDYESIEWILTPNVVEAISVSQLTMYNDYYYLWN